MRLTSFERGRLKPTLFCIGYFPTLETEFSLSLRMLIFTKIDSMEHSSMSTCCKYAQDYESNDVSMKQVIYNVNKH